MDSESMEPYTWRKGPRVNDEYTFDDGGDPTVRKQTREICAGETCRTNLCSGRVGEGCCSDARFLLQVDPGKSWEPPIMVNGNPVFRGPVEMLAVRK